MLTALLTTAAAYASWNSFITNFDKSLYGKGGQTWQICPYDDVWTFMANKNGLVQFDGSTWQLLPIGNGSEVRSVCVAPDQGRVYAGGVNEFGYFAPRTDGTLAYHSMYNEAPDEARLLGNVWGIHRVDNVLYIQGDDRVLKWVGDSCRVIMPDAKIDCSAVVNGVLYIGTDRGVWMLAGHQFFPIQGNEILATKRIRAFLPHRSGVLVVTAYDGLFFSDGKRVTPYHTGIEDRLRRYEVFCAALNHQYIALGTIHSGVVLYNTDSGEVRYLNDRVGMHNNTVLSVAFDPMGNLWAGLDNGIDYLSLESPFTNLYAYPYSLGAGYAAALYDGRLYLGTNRGLYYTEYPRQSGNGFAAMTPIEGASGQVWNLCKMGGDLFCLHDRGLFKVEPAGVRRIGSLTGVWTLRQVTGHPDLMYAGTYNGISLLRKSDVDWHVVGRIEGFNDSCRRFELQNDSVLWVENGDHITRLVVNRERMVATQQLPFGQAEGMSRQDNARVYKLGGQVYVATRSGCYRPSPTGDHPLLVPDEPLNTLLADRFPVVAFAEHEDKLMALTRHELCFAPVTRLTGDASNHRSIHPADTAARESPLSGYSINSSQIDLIGDFETLIPLDGGEVIIPFEDGFALFSPPLHKEQALHPQALSIRKMYITFPGDSLVYRANFTRLKDEPDLGYRTNSVRFEWSVSHLLCSDDVHYRYRLDRGAWSNYSIATVKEYSALHEGEHIFEVEARLPDGTTSTDRLTFRIRPPWYRSPWAFAVYIVLVLIAIRLAYMWDDVRVRRKKQQVATEKERQMKVMEHAYEEEKAKHETRIMLLEKEKLEHDLQHKGQEITNLMINFTRKNEILAEIKSDILKVSAACHSESTRSVKQELLLINNKIDTNMQGDDLLRRIEDQFDLLHNNLMKRLQELHPDLSVNERMMCAYIKMNLSTKEIAPLLNLSVRGVESMRYRLRKKFALERVDGIDEYLSSISVSSETNQMKTNLKMDIAAVKPKNLLNDVIAKRSI